MDTRRLGASDLQITRIGLGAWAMGGEWLFGWGPQDDGDSVAVIRRAVERGINWIDTAAAYGLGHSEEIVGRALADVPAGERPYVFTKCSLVWDDRGTVVHDLHPGSLRRELEGSLRRLRVERIDLYQIHWPRWPSSPPGHEPGSLEEAWRTLEAIRAEGKVRYIGLSNVDRSQVERLGALAPITSVQPPYSVLRRDIEQDLLPYCGAHDIGVIVYSPMQSGLLTGRMTRERLAALPEGDWRRRAKWFQEPYLTRGLALAEAMATIGKRQGLTGADVAVAWVLQQPAVTGAIVGARRPDQIDGFLGATSIRLTADDLANLDAVAMTPI